MVEVWGNKCDPCKLTKGWRPSLIIWSLSKVSISTPLACKSYQEFQKKNPKTFFNGVVIIPTFFMPKYYDSHSENLFLSFNGHYSETSIKHKNYFISLRVIQQQWKRLLRASQGFHLWRLQKDRWPQSWTTILCRKPGLFSLQRSLPTSAALWVNESGTRDSHPRRVSSRALIPLVVVVVAKKKVKKPYCTKKYIYGLKPPTLYSHWEQNI